jgi:hypothetical protein
MANNVMQILRSNTTAKPTSLLPGQMAWSNASQLLWIGNPDGSNTVTPIGGNLVFGTLGANAIMVTNSSSAINQIQTGNVIFVGTTQTLSVGGSTGTAGYVLTSNGSSSNLYWTNPSSFSINTAAQYTWSNTQTFQNTITFSSAINVAANAVINSTGYYWVGNTTTSPTVTIANTGAITVGNSSTTQTTALLSVANSISNVTITAINISIGNSTVNTSSNSTHFFSGNSTVYGLTNSTAEGVFNSNSGGSNYYSNNISNSSSLYLQSGNSSTISTYIYDNVTGNTATVAVGNSTVNVIVGIGVVNVGTQFSVNTTALQFSGANVSFTGTNTNITANTTLTANVTTSGALTTLGGTNTYITSNATFSANVNTSGALTTLGGTNTSVTSNATFAANVNFTGANVVLTGTSITGSTTDVSFRNGTFSGNLVISGSVTTINTTSLTVTDNIVELGSNNGLVASDAVDMGWFSPANTSGVSNYSGIFRIAASSSATNPYFKFLATNSNPNTATTVGGTITTGILESYLAPYGTGGAFIANSTVVNITANATVSSTLTVNSITLTTALAATSGGTGQTTYATGDLLYASSSSALSKLSVPGSAANGQVLQITNNLPAYGTLDGGTF